jgi:mRNA-degrading endonuclease RelE of RelBE toxin-antitoxin system
MKRVLFRPQAARDLEWLPDRDRDRVEEAVERFAQTGSGDVKMLAGEGRQLRLRVGDWRVRFVYRTHRSPFCEPRVTPSERLRLTGNPKHYVVICKASFPAPGVQVAQCAGGVRRE